MRAAMVTGPQQLAVEDVAEPAAEDLALVRPECLGLCGTDASILAGRIPVRYPRILGHEVIGHVVRAGPVGTPGEGERVLVNPSLACGRCETCLAGLEHLCAEGGLIGRDRDGGFAELVALPESQLLPLPDDLPTNAAASLQVLGTCVHAQRSFDVFPGQVAAVVGLGVSGLLMVQLLRARGLATVVGVTRARWKQDLARRFGADAVATPDEADSVVARASDGRGADIVIEAVGRVETFAHAIRLAGLQGTVMKFGTASATTADDFPFYDLYFKELTIRNPRAARREDYTTAIGLATTGAVDLAPLRTHDFPLERATDAFDALAFPRALKVTLEVP